MYCGIPGKKLAGHLPNSKQQDVDPRTQRQNSLQTTVVEQELPPDRQPDRQPSMTGGVVTGVRVLWRKLVHSILEP